MATLRNKKKVRSKKRRGVEDSKRVASWKGSKVGHLPTLNFWLLENYWKIFFLLQKLSVKNAKFGAE